MTSNSAKKFMDTNKELTMRILASYIPIMYGLLYKAGRIEIEFDEVYTYKDIIERNGIIEDCKTMHIFDELVHIKDSCCMEYLMEVFKSDFMALTGMKEFQPDKMRWKANKNTIVELKDFIEKFPHFHIVTEKNNTFYNKAIIVKNEDEEAFFYLADGLGLGFENLFYRREN